ncbi:MAG: hypothetical protein IH947_05960 [Bacteroidetes bacterium]|nr:hypothetical protein [Bacteroidota bacterium]
MVNLIKDIYANPIAAVGLVSGCLCGSCLGVTIGIDYCAKEQPTNGILYTFCTISKTISKIGDAVGSVKAIKTSLQDNPQASNAWCEEAEDLE